MSALYVSILPKKQTLPIELLLFIPINVYWGVNSCSVPYWSHAQQKHSPIHAVVRSSSECFGILSVSCLELATENDLHFRQYRKMRSKTNSFGRVCNIHHHSSKTEDSYLRQRDPCSSESLLRKETCSFSTSIHYQTFTTPNIGLPISSSLSFRKNKLISILDN